jgi:hypothetical protein
VRGSGEVGGSWRAGLDALTKVERVPVAVLGAGAVQRGLTVKAGQSARKDGQLPCARGRVQGALWGWMWWRTHTGTAHESRQVHWQSP